MRELIQLDRITARDLLWILLRLLPRDVLDCTELSRAARFPAAIMTVAYELLLCVRLPIAVLCLSSNNADATKFSSTEADGHMMLSRSDDDRSFDASERERVDMTSATQ